MRSGSESPSPWKLVNVAVLAGCHKAGRHDENSTPRSPAEHGWHHREGSPSSRAHLEEGFQLLAARASGANEGSEIRVANGLGARSPRCRRPGTAESIAFRAPSAGVLGHDLRIVRAVGAGSALLSALQQDPVRLAEPPPVVRLPSDDGHARNQDPASADLAQPIIAGHRLTPSARIRRSARRCGRCSVSALRRPLGGLLRGARYQLRQTSTGFSERTGRSKTRFDLAAQHSAAPLLEEALQFLARRWPSSLASTAVIRATIRLSSAETSASR